MEEEIKTAKFNASQLKILNLNNIWVDSRRYRETGSLEKYKWCLDSAEIELNVDIKTYKFKEQLKKLNDKIKTSNGGTLYLTLIKKEKILRAVEDKSGKGVSYESEDEDDMD